MKITETSSYENLNAPNASYSETSSLNVRDDFGIAPSHLLIMLKNAISNNIVSVWRPVNPEATQMLQEGKYTGKRIATKGKSSTFGPIAGEIPRDAYLGKSFSKFDKTQLEAREENVRRAQGMIDLETEKSVIALAEFKAKFTELKQRRNAVYGDDGASDEEKLKADSNLKEFVLRNDGAEFSSSTNKIMKLEKLKNGDFAISYALENEAAPAANMKELPLSYFVTKESGKPSYDGFDRPDFFVVMDGEKYFYDYENKIFSSRKLEIDSNIYEEKKVEITSYDMVSFDLSKLDNVDFQYDIRNMLVTADYDELVSCGQKIYPTFQSKEVEFKLSSEFHDIFVINRELRKQRGEAVSQSGLLS